MRNLLSLVLSLALSSYGQSSLPLTGAGSSKSSGSGNTWTTSSGWSATGTTSASLNCNPNPCPAVTVPATVSGDLLYVELLTGATGVAYAPVSISAGGTLVTPANCAIDGGAGVGSMGCGYVLSETGGVTSIAVTINTVNSAVFLHFRSYHPSSTTAVAETVPTATTNASCGAAGNACVSPAVTLSGSSDVIIAAFTGGNTGCSVASPYARFASPNGNGFGDQFNVSAGTGASFTQGSSCPTGANAKAVMSTLAFK